MATGLVMNLDHSKMLMVYHKKLGKWVAPGGHIEPDETPIETVIREVKEETGLDAFVMDCSSINLCPKRGSEYQLETPYVVFCEYIPQHGTAEAHQHIDFVYLCEADENATIKQQEAEVKEVKWLTPEQVIKANTFDSMRNFAKTLL